MKYFCLIYLLCFQYFTPFSQDNDKSCVNEVITAEDKLTVQSYNENGKPSFINYKVWSEDWEKTIVQSEVKMYRNQNNLHFFSDQVNIYTDQNESFMVLKPQQLIMASSTPKNALNAGINADFLTFRNKFLKNCSIESCTIIDSIKGVKMLKLVVNKDFEEIVAIKSITYKYDTKSKKVLSTSVTYDDSYKLKKMVITYHSFEEEVDYSFQKPRKYVLNVKGSLQDKFKKYEFVDERSKSVKTK